MLTKELIEPLNIEFKTILDMMAKDLTPVLSDNKPINKRNTCKLNKDLMLHFNWLTSGGNKYIRDGKNIFTLAYTYKGTPIIEILILGTRIHEVKEFDISYKIEHECNEIYFYKEGGGFVKKDINGEELVDVIRKCISATTRKYRVRKPSYDARLKYQNQEIERQRIIKSKRQSSFYQEFINA